MPTHSPRGSKQNWNSLILRGYEDDAEKARSYRPGGHHPVHLGDSLDQGRYLVVHKLGYGGCSTVWLCQDTSHETPKYVAIKVLIAHQSKADCRELLMARQLAKAAVDKKPGGEYICLPLTTFRLTGPNGTHICLVYPVLGPDLSCAMDAFEDVQEPDECARDVRRLARQLVVGLSTLHKHGICHGDLRPSNILLGLKTLDVLSTEEVYALLGEPEEADIILKNASGKPVVVPEIPRYLVYPADLCAVESSHILKHIYITDFGESFDTCTQPARLTGIPRPYCAPELVFDKAAGIEADLWSLGCLLFDARLGSKIIYPADVIGPNDEEYILSVSEILGRLPDPWWTAWDRRDWFFETAEEAPHSRLVGRPGRLAENTPSSVDAPTSIKEKIRASCFKRSYQGAYEKFQDITDEETELLSDLLGRLLQYVPAQRLPAREVADHRWFML